MSAPTLTRLIDGKQYPYSVEEFKKDFPNVSVPKNFAGADLSDFGVFVVQDSAHPETKTAGIKTLSGEVFRVAMHNFLYAIRDIGLRVQFERYVVAELSGYAKDFWLTASYVSKGSTFVGLFQEHFALSDAEVTDLFVKAYNYEE